MKAKTKIIPLTINQYIKILQKVIKLNNDCNIRIKQENIRELLDNLYNASEGYNDSTQWIQTFDEIIEKWGNQFINN